MMIDRRNKRSVQIFFLLITFLLCSGVFFWFYSHPVDEVPDYFPPEVKAHQKTERESALEKVRQLQQNGFENNSADTFYDDQSKKSINDNTDNSGFENARALFQKLNSTAEIGKQINESGEKMTADAFYDEKLKQKQEEDNVGEQKTLKVNEELIPERIATEESTTTKIEEVTEGRKHQEDLVSGVEGDGIDAPKNGTASLDLIGKSEAVQSWLAKQQDGQKSLSEVESSLRVDEAAQLSQRRNPKFEPVDPDIERLKNQIHQFKFVQ